MPLGQDLDGLPPGIDPNDPVVAFLKGLSELLDREGEPSPTELKKGVDRLVAANPSPARDPERSASAQAFDLALDAWEADERGPYLALDALRLDPNCAEAYGYLGHISEGDAVLAFSLYTLGMLAGFESLGPEIFAQHMGEFWGIVETRSFMRSMEGAARTAWMMDEPAMAIGYFSELLRLNPNDNQGARYSLLALALEVGASDAAAEVLAFYAEKRTAMLGFGRALDAFQRAGDSAEARAALAEACAENSFVPAFLTGERPFPPQEPALYQPGSEDEAALVADLYLDAWEGTPGAVEWLARSAVTAAVGPAKAPAKAKRDGPRSIE